MKMERPFNIEGLDIAYIGRVFDEKLKGFLDNQYYDRDNAFAQSHETDKDYMEGKLGQYLCYAALRSNPYLGYAIFLTKQIDVVIVSIYKYDATSQSKQLYKSLKKSFILTNRNIDIVARLISSLVNGLTYVQ
jgi:hypothetical protein